MIPEWKANKCLRCGACVGVCPENAIRLTVQGIVISDDSCSGCGSCVKACPVGALREGE